MATPANALDITAAGLVKFDGAHTFSGVTVTNHDVLVGAASNGITSVGPGSAGQVLRSGGAAANPAYSTATYPGTAGTTGTLLRSDGTNFVNTSSLTVNSSGFLTNTAQPAIRVYFFNGVSNATGDGTTYTVAFDTVINEQGGSNFNVSTGVYTVPIGGYYQINAAITLTGLSVAFTSAIMSIVINGNSNASVYTFNPGSSPLVSGKLYVTDSLALGPLSTNDTVSVNITVSGSTKTIGLAPQSNGPLCQMSIMKLF